MSARPQAAMTALATVGALFLIALSVPHTVAAWKSITAQDVLEKIQGGQRPAPDELSTALAGLTQAEAWSSSARRLTDIAVIELVESTNFFPRDTKREEILNNAEQHVMAGLAAGPGDGFAWFRLARIRDMRSAPPRKIVGALMQSLDIAPHAWALWIPRSELFLNYRSALNEDERLALYSQLRTIWRYGEGIRWELFLASIRAGASPSLLEALGNDPEAQAQYKTLMAELSLPRKAK